MASIFLALLIIGIAYLAVGLAVISIVRMPGVGFWKRVLLAVPLSIFCVPFLFAAITNIAHVQPTLFLLMALSGGIAVLSFLVRRWGKRPEIKIISRAGQQKATALEWVIVLGVIAALTAAFNLPRLDTLLHGVNANEVGSWDVHWHLQELVSVARTGLPPRDFFFPDIRLAYYYWSLVLPAILVNQPFVTISLGQALAIHSIVQGFVCLAVTYWVLRINYSRWGSRITGFAFLTVAGGFDHFVASKADLFEAWQQQVNWLVSRNAIAALSDRYMTTPQHLAGFLVCLLMVLVWRNVRGGAWLRGILMALLGSFALGTSPEIFIPIAIGIFLWAILSWRVWRRWLRIHILCPLPWRARWENARPVVIFCFWVILVFGLGSFQQLLLTTSSGIHLEWNTFRVPLLEQYLGSESARLGMVDRWLTIAGLPVAMVWVLMVEIGLPVILFLYWLVRYAAGVRSTWLRFLALFPLITLPLTFLFRDSAQANNFSRNAAVPAQLVLVLASILLIEWLPRARSARGWSLLAGYALASCLFAQSISTFVEFNILSRPVFGSLWNVNKYVSVGGIPVAQPSLPWPDAFQYIRWANNATPGNAVFIEEAPAQDDIHFRLLERVRFLDPQTATGLIYFYQDSELLVPSQLEALRGVQSGKSLLEAARSSEFLLANHLPMYYVSRSGARTDLGVPVYQDAHVIVYALN